MRVRNQTPRISQLIEAREVQEAQVEDQQGAAFHCGQSPIPEALIIGTLILLVPQGAGHPGDHVQQRGHTPGQDGALAIAQEAALAQQGIQGRAIQGHHGAEVLLSPAQGGWQRSGAGVPAVRHRRQQLLQHPLEQDRRQAAQTLLNSLLRHLSFVDPQQPFAIEHAHRFGDRAELPPDQGEHEGHHHRQVENAFAQPQIVKVGHLVQRRGMDQLGQACFKLLIRCCRIGPLGPVALDGAGMPHRTFLGFSFLAHTSSLHSRARSANADLTNGQRA
jgi:hypothetical protein